MKRSSFAEDVCPIARSLDLVGEWWTFLILRNVIFAGPGRFDGLQQSLGISPNVLSTRLNRLVDLGLLTKRRYSERPPRDEYVATDKGRELMPVLLALAAWGQRWADGDAPMYDLLHGEQHDHHLELVVGCAACDAPVDEAHLLRIDPESLA